MISYINQIFNLLESKSQLSGVIIKTRGGPQASTELNKMG